MSIFKGINPSSINVYELETHKLFNLTSSDTGINSIQYRSASMHSDRVTFNEVGDYWNSLLINFYLSGSHRDDGNKFLGHDLGLLQSINPQHKSKFHSSGSVIFIPQFYFGEKIQKNTFTLETDNVTLKDDGNGNLFSTTLTHTSSADTSISSSKNYKGNIFYSKGVVTITDTGSYGGVDYTDLTTGSFNVKFNATHTIFTAEYVALVNGSDYNMTSNPTARRNIDNKAQYHTELLANNLTSSNWNPFMNTIGFYQDDEKYPTMVARYSQPIKIRNDMNLIFKVRIDF